MNKINSLRGMPDFYSDDLIRWTPVENKLEKILEEAWYEYQSAKIDEGEGEVKLQDPFCQ